MRAVLLMVCVCAAACAPMREGPQQNFVAQRELLAVDLTRGGIAFLAQGRFIDAEITFRQAIYLAPKADNLKLNLAAALQGTGQYVEALEILDEFSKRERPPADLPQRYAHLYAARQQYAQAEKLFLQAAAGYEEKREFPAAVKVVKDLLLLARRQARREDAMCYAYQLLAYQNELPPAIQYARLLIESEAHGAALGFLTAWANEHSAAQDPQVEHVLALANLGQGDSKQAFDLESRIITGAALNTTKTSNLAREAALVRIAAAGDPAVAAALSEEQKTLLAEQWEELSTSIDLDAEEADGWPAFMLALLFRRLVDSAGGS